MAIVWQKYWVNNEYEETIESEASEPVDGWLVCAASFAGSSVYLEDLGWRVDLIRDHLGNWQPEFIDTLLGLPESRPDSWTKIAIRIPRDLIRRVCNPPSEFSRVRHLVRSVLREPEIRRFLKERHEFGPRQSKVWMSPRVVGYPFIYYHVEGAPCLGVIKFDDETWRILHHDLFYIRETPRELDYRRLIDRVQRQGVSDNYSF